MTPMDAVNSQSPRKSARIQNTGHSYDVFVLLLFSQKILLRERKFTHFDSTPSTAD